MKTAVVKAATPLLADYKKLGADKLAEKIKTEVDPNADTKGTGKSNCTKQIIPLLFMAFWQ